MDMRKGQPRVDLDGDWWFAFSEGLPPFEVRTAADAERAGLQARPAVVPGNFELDLLAHGLVPEPCRGMNIEALCRYETAHAWYWRTVLLPAAPDGGDTLLTFEGLDCFADVYLDGALLGRADNMLVAHAFVVPPGPSERGLLVHFRPSVGADADQAFPPLVHSNKANYESLYVRKAPHMYGWDIMPRALSRGIWRPVHARVRPRERLDDAYLETLSLAADGSRADALLTYRGRIDATCSPAYALRVEGACGPRRFAVERPVQYGAGSIRFQVEDPALWSPRGRGEANLYDVRVTLLRDGADLDRLDLRWGIRIVALERTETTDAEGSGAFCFHVNGERVFARGTNWVPLDAYHSRDIDRVDDAVAMAADVGCNIIRCWGGNVYESDRFYDLCDEAGIMVWQDFAMACAVYPQDGAFQQAMRREAEAVTRRLRQHACIVLWAGDNECDQAYAWSGRALDPNANVLTRQVLPDVLRQEDPGRPYLPSSPYLGPEAHRTGKPTPEDHLWGPRDYFKSAFYQGSACHFASEIGYHGCPDPASLREFLSPERVWPYADNEEWLLHCTSPVRHLHLFDYRVELMAKQVRALFGAVPDNLDDYAFASQASQAEAKKFFIEMFRAAKWRRTGIIWWNLLDGWPQFSDAVVDYYWRRKLAYEFIRRAQAPLVAIVGEPADGRQVALVSNDTREPARLECRVTDVDSGETLLEADLWAAADAVTPAGSFPYDPDARRFYVLELREGSRTVGWSHYLCGTPPFDLAWYRECLRVSGLDRRVELT